MLQMSLPRTGPAPVLRGRIGAGFSPVPHRYHLYLSAGCPSSLRVRIARSLLGLEDSVPASVLAPGAPGYAELRRAYDATRHHHTGALTVPALCDTWSGRVVSEHTPDILDDLALRLAGRPDLNPPAPEAHADAVRVLLDPAAPRAERSAALELVARRLAVQPYALAGDRPTVADADLWVALRHPATPVTPAPHVRSYLRRLRAHPAFRAPA
ncbi:MULTISPECIES: cell envelope biogenesis protein OmpA [unclassified Streptomyces]|uniref:cell envelope biogenesis protein OmpA n=1 Tax=unclassified Streptomyces TaxID=2593676 RepID=UPI00225B4357|nr:MULTISPECIES: cell envelope biogenesis protein OmpA [unclassified Streptomyces]MCX4524760.1 cell envelope biogenesis protein OmpA [Streptomyces sp. NBC_01551]MCX4544730.1 cell envelope biogenesis protein OmpA [Streptomyces sp. NBC_01565]